MTTISPSFSTTISPRFGGLWPKKALDTLDKKVGDTWFGKQLYMTDNTPSAVPWYTLEGLWQQG